MHDLMKTDETSYWLRSIPDIDVLAALMSNVDADHIDENVAAILISGQLDCFYVWLKHSLKASMTCMI